MSLSRVALLGSVEAYAADGARLSLGSSQQKALLTILCLRVNAPVSVDALVEAVWEAPVPSTAPQLLYTHVSRLRRQIQPESSRWQRKGVLTSADGGYVLSLLSACLDVHSFEQRLSEAYEARARGDLQKAADLMDEALSLWRGEPFTGLPGPLLRAERGRLQEQHLSVRQDRLELNLRLGRHRETIPALLGMASEYPLQERAVELLMIALYREGRQSDALGAYADLRQALDNELGVEPSRALQDLHLRILRADSALMRISDGGRVNVRSPDAGSASGTASPLLGALAAGWATPAQLPRDIVDFTGRVDEMSGVVDWLSSAGDTGVPLVAVAGRGGVGKTTLAVHAAHRVRSMFPDGQLYVSLRGTHEDPVTSAHVLEYFLHAIGPHRAELSDSFEERMALFRTWLAGRRILIVLDDARNEEQVRPLLPGSPGCAVVVTSRTPLVGFADARHLTLDLLDESDGLEMLYRALGPRRVEAEPGPASEIVKACAGLPLAIQIAAGKLLAHPHWPLRYLSTLLRDESRRLDGLTVADRAIRSSIALTVNLLEPEQHEAFVTLALTDLPSLDVGAAAALLRTSHGRAADLIDSLVLSQLLDVVGWGPVDELRVRFHDLVRLFAREQATTHLDPATCHAAIARLLDRYLALAAVADVAQPLNSDCYLDEDTNALGPHDSSLIEWIKANAVAWFADELNNIHILVRQAARMGLDSYPWRLLARTGAFCQLHSRLEAWPDIGQVSLQCARRAADHQAEAQALFNLGKIDSERSEGRRGIAELQAALDLFREIGDRRGQARALKDLGGAAWLIGDLKAGTRLINEAIRIADGIGDDSVLADSLVTLASIMLAGGDADRAQPEAVRAHEIYQRLQAPIGDAQALTCIAACHRAAGNERAAKDILLQCLSVVEDLGDLHGQACVLRDLGMLDIPDNEAETVVYLERSLALCDELQFLRIRGQVLYAYGRLSARQGDRRGAERLLIESLQIMEGVNNADWRQRVHTALDELNAASM
jgi:DNA-binding SARP family transcriptional activator/tetratricopeptide (TPR) repeat protein